MFSQLACILCGVKNYNAGSWLPAATSAITYAPLAGGVMGQAGSQIRGQQGPSEGAHAGTVLEDSPSDRRSSSRGFLRGCWYVGNTHWRLFFFYGSENTRHNIDSQVAIGFLKRINTAVSMLMLTCNLTTATYSEPHTGPGFLNWSPPQAAHWQ